MSLLWLIVKVIIPVFVLRRVKVRPVTSDPFIDTRDKWLQNGDGLKKFSHG